MRGPGVRCHELRPKSCSAGGGPGLQAAVTSLPAPGGLVNTQILMRWVHGFPAAAVSSAQQGSEIYSPCSEATGPDSRTALCRRLGGDKAPSLSPAAAGLQASLCVGPHPSGLCLWLLHSGVSHLPLPLPLRHWWRLSGVTVTGDGTVGRGMGALGRKGKDTVEPHPPKIAEDDG